MALEFLLSKTCPHSATCSLYPLFGVEALLSVWKMQYCDSRYESCVRYRLSQEGQEPAPNLLPNGKELPVVRRD